MEEDKTTHSNLTGTDAPRIACSRRSLLLTSITGLSRLPVIAGALGAADRLPSLAACGGLSYSSPRGILSGQVTLREDVIRWSANSRYLLTRHGIFSMDGGGVDPSLKYAANQHRWTGCDWAPGQSRIVFSREQAGVERLQEIILTPIKKLAPVLLVGQDVGPVNTGPAWEPGGPHLCFLSHLDRFDAMSHPYARRRLCIKNQLTQQVRVLIDGGVISDRPLWAPGGKKVLISVLTTPTNSASAPRTLLIDAASGRTTEIKLRGQYDYETKGAAWSPNGTSIVFTAAAHDASNLTRLCLWNARTGVVTQLVNDDVDYAPVLQDPAFSPDGRRIAYVHDSHHRGLELMVVSIAAKKPQRLYTAPKHHFLRNPTWSPDGKSLVFWQEHHSRSRLYQVRLDQPQKVKLLV